MKPTGRHRVTLVAHLQTWRPYTLWYVGLLSLAGAGLASGGHHWRRLLLAWAAPTIGWIGGHYLGDYFDRRLDAISKPHRPIPSGRLRPAHALVSGLTCVALVGVLAGAAGWSTVAVAGLAVAGMIGYSRGLKARGLAGNLTRGALGALALLYGALSTTSTPGWTLLPFAAAVWAHDTSSNIVGTLRDVTGDRAGGYRTVPVRHGTGTGVRVAAAFYGLAIAVALAGGLARSDDPGFVVLLAGAAALGGVAFSHLATARSDLPVRTALRAHELLVLERVGFAAALILLGIGATTALILLAPALAATWWTQSRMRSAYELGP